MALDDLIVAELFFAVPKYRIFGHSCVLLHETCSALTEIILAAMVYNLEQMANLLGASKLILRPHHI